MEFTFLDNLVQIYVKSYKTEEDAVREVERFQPQFIIQLLTGNQCMRERAMTKGRTGRARKDLSMVGLTGTALEDRPI